MKKIIFASFFALLLCSCNGKDVFDGQYVSSISVTGADTNQMQTTIKYDNQDRLVGFDESTFDSNGKELRLLVDSVVYKTDTVFMYMDNNTEKQKSVYILSGGYAINCYTDSETDGYISASFHYIGGQLVSVHETRSISFKNKPDTIYTFSYDAQNNLIKYKDKGVESTFFASETKNKNNLLLPPVKLGMYTPAFYAGLLGKMSYSFIESSETDYGKIAYKYTINKEGVLLDMKKDGNEPSMVFDYKFK